MRISSYGLARGKFAEHEGSDSYFLHQLYRVQVFTTEIVNFKKADVPLNLYIVY